METDSIQWGLKIRVIFASISKLIQAEHSNQKIPFSQPNYETQIKNIISYKLLISSYCIV